MAVLAAHHWVKTRSEGPYLTQRDIGKAIDEMGIDLSCNLETSVGNTDEDPVIESFVPDDGPDWYIIRQRDDEFVMGDDFAPAVQDECERAISHIDAMDGTSSGDGTAVADGPPPTNEDGETLREVIAEAVDEEPKELEEYIRRGRARERRSKLNEVVDAVEESEFDKPDSYDKIELRPNARRYHLSDHGISEYSLA
ncbi:hypothetical protein [Halobellus rubicundus]|uniref:Uncharacterized protein n=1 Tax=Halobellus rubicundus TaxID=2996466 RepID=A0ABD5MIM6_9EURY